MNICWTMQINKHATIIRQPTEYVFSVVTAFRVGQASQPGPGKRENNYNGERARDSDWCLDRASTLMILVKNRLREISTTLPTQLECLTNQPCKTSPLSSRDSFCLFPLLQILLRHRAQKGRQWRYIFARPVCFSCTSTTTQPCWQQTPQTWQ